MQQAVVVLRVRVVLLLILNAKRRLEVQEVAHHSVATALPQTQQLYSSSMQSVNISKCQQTGKMQKDKHIPTNAEIEQMF